MHHTIIPNVPYTGQHKKDCQKRTHTNIRGVSFMYEKNIRCASKFCKLAADHLTSAHPNLATWILPPSERSCKINIHRTIFEGERVWVWCG